MNKEALGKLALIQGAVEGKYTVREVSIRLKLSNRRVKQLKKAFRERGESAFIHGNSGRHPANSTDEKLKEKIIALKKSAIYSEANFTHFRELLAEREGIQISYTTLSSVLKSAGIVSKRKHRSEGRRYRRRERKARFGEMLQGDGSPYDWFGSGQRCTLHGFIDDATGRLTGLYFCQNECLMGYLEVMRQTLTKYGIPLELYIDKAGIFFVNNKKEENWTVEELLAGRPLDKTQFGAIVDEQLGINMISAHTPQAKGRVERLWGTLQDRLPVWLKLNNIADMEQANRNIKRIIAWFNKRFAVEPALAETAFIPVDASCDLDKLLTVRYERTTDNCGCFSFSNFIFQINSKKPLARKKIIFMFSQKIGFQALCGKEYYTVSFLGIKSGKRINAPDVTKILIDKVYYSDGKGMAA